LQYRPSGIGWRRYITIYIAESRDMRGTRAAGLTVKGYLRPARLGHDYLGSERIDLLEATDACGSISQAAKQVELSYKAAWEAVEAMNNLAEKPLLIRVTGGARRWQPPDP
jgi:Bacterial regulatory helix-turn-helix protein, lysR family